jgi:hypothetical protein
VLCDEFSDGQPGLDVGQRLTLWRKDLDCDVDQYRTVRRLGRSDRFTSPSPSNRRITPVMVGAKSARFLSPTRGSCDPGRKIAPGPICHGDTNGERLHRVLPGRLPARASGGERGSAMRPVTPEADIERSAPAGERGDLYEIVDLPSASKRGTTGSWHHSLGVHRGWRRVLIPGAGGLDFEDVPLRLPRVRWHAHAEGVGVVDLGRRHLSGVGDETGHVLIAQPRL